MASPDAFVVRTGQTDQGQRGGPSRFVPAPQRPVVAGVGAPQSRVTITRGSDIRPLTVPQEERVNQEMRTRSTEGDPKTVVRQEATPGSDRPSSPRGPSVASQITSVASLGKAAQSGWGDPSLEMTMPTCPVVSEPGDPRPTVTNMADPTVPHVTVPSGEKGSREVELEYAEKGRQSSRQPSSTEIGGLAG